MRVGDPLAARVAPRPSGRSRGPSRTPPQPRRRPPNGRDQQPMNRKKNRNGKKNPKNPKPGVPDDGAARCADVRRDAELEADDAADDGGEGDDDEGDEPAHGVSDLRSRWRRRWRRVLGRLDHRARMCRTCARGMAISPHRRQSPRQVPDVARRRDPRVIGRHPVAPAGDLLERDGLRRVPAGRDHDPERPAADEVRGRAAQAGREQAVDRRRRAAALDVAEDRHARLEARQLLGWCASRSVFPVCCAWSRATSALAASRAAGSFARSIRLSASAERLRRPRRSARPRRPRRC